MLIEKMRRNQVRLTAERVDPERAEAIQHAKGLIVVSPMLHVQIGICNRVRVMSLPISRSDDFQVLKGPIELVWQVVLFDCAYKAHPTPTTGCRLTFECADALLRVFQLEFHPRQAVIECPSRGNTALQVITGCLGSCQKFQPFLVANREVLPPPT